MKVTSEYSASDVRKKLMHLRDQVSSCETISRKMRAPLMERIDNLLSVNKINKEEAKKLILDVEGKLSSVKEQVDKKIKYIGDLEFNDFLSTGHLYEVNNSAQKGSLYFYYDEESIDDFNDLNDIVQEKFTRLINKGDVKIARAKNDQGIKFLGTKENLPDCTLRINNEYLETSIHYELKVMGTEDRIAITSLKSKTEGPEILFATHAIKGGFHSNKQNGKHLNSNNFVIPKKEESKAEIIGKIGIFSNNKVSATNKITETPRFQDAVKVK